MTDDQLNFGKLVFRLGLYGAIFVILAGSALHFVYGWSHNNFIVGLLSPVNESPWEHMKLVFTPMAIFAFVEYYYLRKRAENYCFSLAAAIFYAIAFILIVFYFYTPIVKHSILAVDIGSFVVGVILAKMISYKILVKKIDFSNSRIYSVLALVVLAGFFAFATLNPPRNTVFQDPIDQTYGINRLE